MTELINLALTILLIVAMYKVIGYFYAWVESKWGKKVKYQVSLLGFLLILNLLFLTGERTLGFILLGLHLGLITLVRILGFISVCQIRKLVRQDYINVKLELHRLNKIGWGESMKAEKLIDMEKKIWEVLDDKDKNKVTKILPTYIEEYDKMLEAN